MEEQQEFDFALNEAAIYFQSTVDGLQLCISYGAGSTISIDMTEDFIPMVRDVLHSGDFWMAFLGALSAAVDKVKEQNDTTE